MVLDFEAALAEVMRRANSLRENLVAPETERADLLEAAGRVLVQPVLADRDQPPFDRATRDGFAVRAAECSAGLALRIIGQVRAGDAWAGPPMGGGEAIEIMTGAPVPAGADAAVMVEHVSVSDGGIRIAAGRQLRSGENVVLRGSEAGAGDAVLAAGTVIGAAEIALAAACGMAEVKVHARPKVAIVATGDELVEIDEVPDDQKIRNSNSYGLAALVASAGGDAERLAIARDERQELRERITQARQTNLMLLSGGVSMGKFDLVEEVLAEFGAEFFFTGVKMQPGKPVVFGRLPERAGSAGTEGLRECYFFGLPGNPISTQVTFHCFVEPFLRTMCGEAVTGPKFSQATLAEEIEGKPGLMRMLPAYMHSDIRQPLVRLVGWRGSGDLAANVRANCYAVLPPGRMTFRAGDVISVLLR